VEPDAKHQQDNADLRQLSRHADVADKPRCSRTDDDASHKIPNDGRQADRARNQAATQGSTKGESNCGDEVYLMHGFTKRGIIAESTRSRASERSY
jgi:hypothetical protein